MISINKYLDEEGASVDLFAALAETQPDFTASVYDLAERALVALERFDLAKKFMGDPFTRLASAKEEFEDLMQTANSMPNPDMYQQSARLFFPQDVVHIITVLDKTGDAETAREIQAQALEILDAPAIRNAIVR